MAEEDRRAEDDVLAAVGGGIGVDGRCRAIAVVAVVFQLVGVHAGQQGVPDGAGLEAALQLVVEREAFTAFLAGRSVTGQHIAGADPAGLIDLLGGDARFLVAQVLAELPAVIEVVLELIAVQLFRAAHTVGRRAIVETGGEGAAVTRHDRTVIGHRAVVAGGRVVLQIGLQQQPVAAIDAPRQRGREQVALGRGKALLRAPGLALGQQAVTQIRPVADRAGQVDAQPALAVTADTQFDLALRGVQRALAGQGHQAAGRGLTVGDRVRPAHHIDAFDGPGVDLQGVAALGIAQQAQSVQPLIGIHMIVEAAQHDVVVARARADRGAVHPGGVVERFGQRLRVLILDLPARHHRDRLGGFVERRVRLGRRARGGRAVAMGGGQRIGGLVGIHRHRRQRGAVVGAGGLPECEPRRAQRERQSERQALPIVDPLS